jgi:hypothetical protein
MKTDTSSASESEFGPDNFELLSRQLAERGFYVIGLLVPTNRKPACSRIAGSRPDSTSRA